MAELTGEGMRILREHATRSRHEWAEMLGITEGSLRNIENGTREIGPTLEALALLLAYQYVRNIAPKAYREGRALIAEAALLQGTPPEEEGPQRPSRPKKGTA